MNDSVPPSRRSSLAAVLRWSQPIFGIVALIFLVIAFRSTLGRPIGNLVPDAWRIAAAVVLILASLLLAAQGWLALLASPGLRTPLLRGYLLAQLGKYIPGAVWGAAGQIVFATRSGISLGRTAAAYPVFALTQAAAAATAGALLVAWPGSQDLVGLAAPLLALALVLLLYRRWMVWVLGRIAGWLRRDLPRSTLPSQGNIIKAYAWAILAIVASGAAFALVLPGLLLPDLAQGVTAFAFAWTVGFLALPFPSGLGVREAVLVGALAGSFQVAPVLAASAVHRLTSIAVEVLAVLVSRVRMHRVGHPD